MSATPVARPMVRREARASIALVLVGATVAACGVGLGGGTSSPASSTTPAPTLPGTPGHFDDGQEAFDYPADWPAIAGGFSSGGVMYVLAVLGDGDWQNGCVETSNALSCTGDKFSPAPGGILVKVYRWWGGPAVPCRGDVQANETFGSLAVRKSVGGTETSWEIRLPGNEFGQSNNVFVEAHTSDAAELAKAEALVASFRWGPSAPNYEGLCSPSPAGSPAG